jgi:hypothetical protein
VEAAGAARAASSTVAERVERNAISRLEVGNAGSNLDYFTARFVAHHEWEAADHPIGAEFPLIQMKVRPADSAGTDFDEEFAFAGMRGREIHQFCTETVLGLC